jgi:universal stress protein A
MTTTTTNPNRSRAPAQSGTSRSSSSRKRPRSVRLRHILVPIDFSSTSHRALDFALTLAIRFGARISLVHVIEPIIYPQEVGPIAISEVRLAEHALKELTALARQTVPAANLKKVLTRTGLPYREITDAARQFKADLIVLTTHGHTGFRRVFLGSTAERIVRHAHCPVLTVRQ